MPYRSIIFPRGMVRAAGAVVWRMKSGRPEPIPGEPVSPKDLEVLLVHRPRYRDWSWPKGKAERNEPLAVGAVREVEEETGEVVALGAPLTTQRYRLSSGHLKEVYYWVGHVIPKHSPPRATRFPVELASSKEIDIAKWMSTKKASQLLTRRGDRRLLVELIGRAARGELQTTAVTLLRHAKGVRREKWDGDEATRPLTRLGGGQALDLVPLLSAFGTTKVITSPWKRCEQTVAPYVALGSPEYTSYDFLTEEGVGENPKASSKLVKKLMVEPWASTVISLHRPGFEALVTPLREVSPRIVAAAMDQPKPGLRRGEMLVVHVALSGRPHAIGTERHRPMTALRVV